MKQVNLRLPDDMIEQLRLRAVFEDRTVNEILRTALEQYIVNTPVPREKLLAMVDAIVKEDATLLKLLAE